MIDLKIPEHAYFYGLMLTDGHLSETDRNRGKLSIELKAEDSDLIHKISKLFPVHCNVRTRIRSTNFQKDAKSVLAAWYSYELRTEMKQLGFPVGRKSDIIEKPIGNFCEVDFVRGLIDGDGSVCYSAAGLPVIGFTTKSEAMKNYFADFLVRAINHPTHITKNRRDNVYNFCINGIAAKLLYQQLYYPKCLCLERKRLDSFLNYKPNKTVPNNRGPNWTKTDDEYLLTHTIDESLKFFKNRSVSSVKTRLWRVQRLTCRQ